MHLCVQFEGTIGAEGLTFKLLERWLNNNFEPPDELLTMQEVSNPITQTWCLHSNDIAMITRARWMPCAPIWKLIMEPQKEHKGMGEISLFGGVAIGHNAAQDPERCSGGVCLAIPK